MHRCAVQMIASPALSQREVEFTKTAWLAGLRPDQRGAQQLREVKVEFPLLSRDMVCVRCGGTVVIAAIACELVEPSPYRPKHGMLEFSVRQSYTERDGTAKAAELRSLAAYIERLVRAGGVLDTENLCVLPGRRVWSVGVGVTVLNDEGGATDAAVWAVMAVLLHFRRPELTVRGGSVVVHPPHERDPVPLSVHHTPLSFSFAITTPPSERSKLAREGRDRAGALDVVVDPTAAEAIAAASSVMVAVNAEGQVCSVSKSEGCCIHLSELNYCIETASALAPSVLELIRAAMASHDAKRQEALKGQFLWAQKRSGVGRETTEQEAAKKCAMDSGNLQDEELGTSEVLWSPDLDARWRLLRRHITPFEKDRMTYHTAKYQKPVFVHMNPIIWHCLVEKQGAYRAVDFMLMLGFALAPERGGNLAEWTERDPAATIRINGGTSAIAAPTTSLSLTASAAAGFLTGRRSTTTTTTTTATTTGASALLPGAGEETRPSSGVRFWVLNHEESRPPTSGSPVNQYTSPRSSALSVRTSNPGLSTAAGPLSSPNAKSASVGSCCGGGSSAVVVEPHADADAAISRIRNLEAEVKDLTRQIRILKSRESDRDVSVTSDVVSQSETPQPHIIVCPDRPFIASTNCHALVCLPVNYLDPDCAPYVVSLGASTGRVLLACTIVEHRYVIFLAPPHRRGSLAVVLLCTRDGTLRPYTRAVWLEYRAQDPPNTLTHHAVNQLLQEIPLPSSATAVDPNPSEVEQTKSESAFEDDNTYCDTDTAISTSDHGLESEPRLPLTKEMLELIPNGFITGRRVPHTATIGENLANDRTLSPPGSEGSLGGAEREERTTTGRLWNDNDEMKPGSTSMSTVHPTSYQRGQPSGFSDEENIQNAFNCMTNHTEPSSSTATSVISADSTGPNRGFGIAGIMASRGWVGRCLQGTPQSSQSCDANTHGNSLSATGTVMDDPMQSVHSPSLRPRRGSVASL